MKKADAEALKQGSSPLTRGKLPGRAGDDPGARLIPAHAGKTRSAPTYSAPTTAHPRSRGENTVGGFDVDVTAGSSPLTRGKQVGVVPGGAEVGLIPAHAGKTRHSRRPLQPIGAHPRSRGENLARLTAIENAAGSSPLTRGKHGLDDGHAPPVRLIPAHAGKTRAASVHLRIAWAHPRSRGENLSGQESVYFFEGSSPLTRGKQEDRTQLRDVPRLIPAHAGKTQKMRSPGFAWEAHPRSRGENPSVWSFLVGHRGSSPLTRGKRPRRCCRRTARRLIPAHAGKTRCCR